MKIPWCSTSTRMLTLSYKNYQYGTLFHHFVCTIYRYGFVDGFNLSADGLDSLLKLCHLDYYNTVFRLPCYSYWNKRLLSFKRPPRPPPAAPPDPWNLINAPGVYYIIYGSCITMRQDTRPFAQVTQASHVRRRQRRAQPIKTRRNRSETMKNTTNV